MTQEEKDLLLQDLCARLPYRVVVELDENFRYNKGTRYLVKELLDIYCVEGIKPYLRPMSSMTIDESYELDHVEERYDNHYDSITAQIDWLNAHHFDYRGLIEKGLALESKEGMYK